MAKLQSHPLSSALLCLFLFFLLTSTEMMMWKENSVRGVVKHGQEFVLTLATATASEGPGIRPHMELVMHGFQELHASATLTVNQLSIWGCYG